MTGGQLARALAQCWAVLWAVCVVGGKVVCRGIFPGLFCCQGCLVQSGFVFTILIPTLYLPNHSHIHPARGPSFLLYWDRQSSDGISQSLPESDKLSSGSPGGDSQGPGQTGAGTWDRLHVPMCRVHGALLLLGHQVPWWSALLCTR